MTYIGKPIWYVTSSTLPGIQCMHNFKVGSDLNSLQTDRLVNNMHYKDTRTVYIVILKKLIDYSDHGIKKEINRYYSLSYYKCCTFAFQCLHR